MKIVLVVFAFIALAFAQSPPQWPIRFKQDFVESYTYTSFNDVGTVWYDFQRGMQRTDRRFGKYDRLCGSIVDAITPCIQLVRDGNRFMVFPERRQCCFCCDAAHGCSVLRRDWTKTLTFAGKEDLSGQTFNKFQNIESQTDLWTAIGGKQIPRKLFQDKIMAKDYIMNTYSEDPIEDSIFALPSYCNLKNLCPQTSLCSRFRG